MVALPRAALTLEMRQILARRFSAVSGGFRLVEEQIARVTVCSSRHCAVRDTVQFETLCSSARG